MMGNVRISGPNPVEVSPENKVVVETKRSLKSVFWKHFERTKENDVWKAMCIYYKKKLNGGSKEGTSHLMKH